MCGTYDCDLIVEHILNVETATVREIIFDAEVFQHVSVKELLDFSQRYTCLMEYNHQVMDYLSIGM